MSNTVVPVARLQVEDVADLPEPVSACASCGYLGIRPPTMGEGGLPGVSVLMGERVCPRCAHRGPPVEFDTRLDYVAFVAALHEFPSQRE